VVGERHGLEPATNGGTRIRDVWNPPAGSVAPYGFPAVEPGVRSDESRELISEFLGRFPESPFGRWARTLV
jgi:hypothetical protein